MLERYGHGGDWLTASELYGVDSGSIVDFSANMNPFGPPACVAELLRRYADMIGRYPDPAVRGLRRKLAQQHGVEEGCIVAGNGAAELIELVVRLFAPEVTVVAAPSFAEYSDAARKAGSRVQRMPLSPQNGFKLSMQLVMDTLAQLRDSGVTQGRALWFIGTPNNPTGGLCDPAIIRELVRLGERVVVDEAFMDFVPDGERWSVLKDAVSSPNLIVIRSMTKFYSIPGIRLGYAAASADVCARLGGLQVPWSVNSLAQQIGEAVLDDTDYREKSIRWLIQERDWFSGQLSALGLSVFDSASNYLLLALPEEAGITSTGLQAMLGKRGILIRNGARFDGLDGRYCRLAVRNRADNERLLQELGRVLGHAAGTKARTAGQPESRPGTIIRTAAEPESRAGIAARTDAQSESRPGTIIRTAAQSESKTGTTVKKDEQVQTEAVSEAATERPQASEA